MGRHLKLSITITPLFQSMEGTYYEQVCIVALGAHLVLSVLAALGIRICWLYVCLYCGCLEHTLCCLYVGYMYCVVLGTHLVQEGSGPCKIPNLSHLLWSNAHAVNS